MFAFAIAILLGLYCHCLLLTLPLGVIGRLCSVVSQLRN